jgi:hypothetical protein
MYSQADESTSSAGQQIPGTKMTSKWLKCLPEKLLDLAPKSNSLVRGLGR